MEEKEQEGMLKQIRAGEAMVEYSLQYKKVKNINLRIKPDGTVYVSANKGVPQKVIDEFVMSKADFIQKALDRYKNREDAQQEPYYTESEVCEVITAFCKEAYPYYAKYGIQYPQIRFRKMVSRWGSCHPIKGILTFNLNLMYAPPACIAYVVWHEFTHFLQANHGKEFYEELEKVCPDWRVCRQKLKEISVR